MGSSALLLCISLVICMSVSRCYNENDDKDRLRISKLADPALDVSPRADDPNPLEAVVAQLSQTVNLLTARVQAAESNQGSVFTRWGRSTCPDGTRTLYSGIAAGSYYNHPGGGANRLCVTKQPVFDNMQADGGHGQLSGIEYYIHGHHHTDVVCAVCKAPKALTYMLPGTNRCPQGEVLQYKGYLSAGDHNHVSATEYLCMDASPEELLGSGDNKDSAYMEHVTAHCGALPCPPYIENRVVTCAVCSTS